jgi:hypothetical protein
LLLVVVALLIIPGARFLAPLRHDYIHGGKVQVSLGARC